MSNFDRDYAIMEGERIGAWDAYSAARPDVNRDPIYERMFGEGFDRGWQKRSTRPEEHAEVEKLRLGYDRYEKLRLLNVQQFQDLFLRNLKGEASFDDLVDASPKIGGQ